MARFLLMQKPGTCRPGFQVADLDKFHARMIEHDVPCIQEPTEMFGSGIAQYLNPDGLVWAVSHARAET